MAKRRTKLSLVTVCLVTIFSLVIGLCGGAFGAIYLSAETYVIPEAVEITHTSAGSIDVGVVKAADASVHFLELGNKYTGDCVFIKSGETEILVDAGSRADSVDDIYNYVSPFVDGALDYVIVTHAHQDHYAGFATKNFDDSLFAKFENVTTVVTFAKSNQKETSSLYKNFNDNLAVLRTKGTEVKKVNEYFNGNAPKPEAKISLGATATLEFLYQKYYDEKASTENDYSVCFQIRQKRGSDEDLYLFTGDLEDDGEKSLVDENTGRLGKTKLFKAGHHGSKTSSSDKLLSVIQPDTVCVCACAGSPEYTKNKDNQFPTQAFCDRVFKYTENVYVTTLCVDYEAGRYESFNGNIVYYSAGGKSGMLFSASAQKLKESDWFKANRR